MKNYIKTGFLSLMIITSFIFVGCSEDYLSDPEPTEVVAESVIFGTREGVEAFLSGINRRARGQFTRTDSGGLNSMYFARTVKGNDLIHARSWFSFDYDNDNREPTYTRTVFSWEFPYYMINQLNSCINGVEASALSEIDKTELIGQAKALRGFYYFQLALEFQEGYTASNRDLPAPPIYTELSLEGKPMGTLGELYDFIVDDLTTAVSTLPKDRLGKSYINVDVANGILARVYLTMGNWKGAEDAANAAYGGDVASVLDSKSYGNGFDDINNKEWIWGLPQTGDQTNYYYNAPSAFIDNVNDAYNNMYINEFFSNEFTATDARNTFVVGTAPNYTKVTSTKFIFAFSSDIVIMRTAEMILIEAEAKFRQGDEIGARDLMYELQSDRDPLAVKSTNTGSALEEEILLERRKELYGEIGVEWFDAKRLQRGIVRTPNHRIVKTLEPNDKRFYLKIPQVEIDANENIDDSVNSGR
ncbi:MULTISPECIES: RagB/SusD family nutrient uptake outer membrane protein [unclassified Cellulophaga]|uniref:RagB/SusD family nutrient uptake outer membrane protein n=1 Tax=unclassified Cellulophaga TaxID=2634405 RepID=UPI0026E3A559|nr:MULTISPECIES: RagB/SusD family nutrient uptake outer membrane protein [unclassified Cellulophaga]MDO6491958.1 RagB/SusD family nutrient uptake outer membrane protein [Cellulophaga sp. 2_MG-2023]MDO6495387.1 RagB/SusD family nutrient uptake outer membrane protein [Cellulophaga sp. 3_MG-2023]